MFIVLGHYIVRHELETIISMNFTHNKNIFVQEMLFAKKNVKQVEQTNNGKQTQKYRKG